MATYNRSLTYERTLITIIGVGAPTTTVPFSVPTNENILWCDVFIKTARQTNGAAFASWDFYTRVPQVAGGANDDLTWFTLNGGPGGFSMTNREVAVPVSGAIARMTHHEKRRLQPGDSIYLTGTGNSTNEISFEIVVLKAKQA